MQSEVFKAFRSIDVPEDKAFKAAEALSRRDPDLSSDLKTLRTDVGALKTDVAVFKWMLGFVLALQVAIAVKLFLH